MEWPISQRGCSINKTQQIFLIKGSIFKSRCGAVFPDGYNTELPDRESRANPFPPSKLFFHPKPFFPSFLPPLKVPLDNNWPNYTRGH